MWRLSVGNNGGGLVRQQDNCMWMINEMTLQCSTYAGQLEKHQKRENQISFRPHLRPHLHIPVYNNGAILIDL